MAGDQKGKFVSGRDAAKKDKIRKVPIAGGGTKKRSLDITEADWKRIKKKGFLTRTDTIKFFDGDRLAMKKEWIVKGDSLRPAVILEIITDFTQRSKKKKGKK